MRAVLWVLAWSALILVGLSSLPGLSRWFSEERYRRPDGTLDPARNLTSAVIHQYGNGCRVGGNPEDCSHCRELIAAASEQELMSAYTEVMSSPKAKDFCVGNVARLAADLPYSAEFHHALRDRRDRMREGKHRLFPYFAKHGDECELAWMEEVAKPLQDYNLSEAERSIQSLRERLADQGQ
jgi:hypothetical protein